IEWRARRRIRIGDSRSKAAASQIRDSPLRRKGAFVNENRDIWIPICPGLKRKTIALGETMMQVYVILDAGARMPEHSHHPEQLCTCLRGRIRLIVKGQPVELGPGESLILHSNVPH